ncbi:hypothetical protein LYSIN_02310 [Lysinibacillus sphaericus]|uniref:Uncharacterized protein n=1 Tax=Lysinibacillus sphaericus TaxID=1421 RepID=A0A2S5D369_LYSSH|nr:hypothetical protein LYSIN_02310 [Lysinibacillus sphaericus]
MGTIVSYPYVLFKGVTAVGKIHAFYDEKGNRIPV